MVTIPIPSKAIVRITQGDRVAMADDEDLRLAWKIARDKAHGDSRTKLPDDVQRPATPAEAAAPPRPPEPRTPDGSPWPRPRARAGPMRGIARLGFALLLKFFTSLGRFPAGRGELVDEVVAFVAKQVKVAPAELGFYDWSGRQIKAHRAEIRRFLGFRECTVVDAEKMTAWLAEMSPRRSGARSRSMSSCWTVAGRSGSSRPRGFGSHAVRPGEQPAAAGGGTAGGADRRRRRRGPGSGRRRRGWAVGAGADQGRSGQRELGEHADGDRQLLAVRSIGLPAGPVRRCRAEGAGRVAGAGRGGVAVAPACAPEPGQDAHATGGAERESRAVMSRRTSP